MKKQKQSTSLQQYLAPYIATGDAVAIQTARAAWRRQYKTNWKKQKRQKQKTLELFFNAKEWTMIQRQASKHHLSHTGYVKNAALAYSNKTYMVRDHVAYSEIREALHMLYLKLKRLEEQKMFSQQTSYDLLHVFHAIQGAITQQLQIPQTLEETIITVIKANPTYKSVLLHILQSVD
jgi:hypothetical protein